MEDNGLKRKVSETNNNNGANQQDKKKKKKKNAHKKATPIVASNHTPAKANKPSAPAVPAEKGSKKKNKAKLNAAITSNVNIESNEKYGKVEWDANSTKDLRSGLDIADDEDYSNSESRARDFFEWMIAPISVEAFYDEYWEKKPLLIKRNKKDYYSGWFTKDEMDKLFKTKHLLYSKHLDVTSYENGVRKTLNPEGKATAKQVWDFFSKGCSIRMLHPQQYADNVSKMLSILEDFWQCGGGCNTYLTPAGNQGFAPHYDDVEAFVLQTEGAKQWRVYAPLSEGEVLPRFSSKNFSQSEIGKPILEVTLECGDMLYFPRGYIHQAISVPEHYSLHITVSTALRNTWGDFMELVLPRAAQMLFEDNVELRQSLPRDFFQHMGVMMSDTESARRKEYIAKFFAFLEQILTNVPIDAIADQMALGFIESRLPPHVVPSTTSITAVSATTPEEKEIKLSTYMAMVNAGAARMVVEEDLAVVYTPVKNRCEIHANKNLQADDIKEEDIVIEFPIEYSSAVEHIVTTYPVPFRVSSIPLEKNEEKLEFAKKLFEHGVLLIRADVEDEK